MVTSRTPSSPALLPSSSVGPHDPAAWQVVLVNRGTKSIVLHNSHTSEFAVSRRHELLEDAEDDLEVISQQQDESDTGSTGSVSPPTLRPRCPLCRRPTSRAPTREPPSRRLPLTKDSSYFNLLSEANSRANTPRTTRAGEREGAGVADEEPALDKATLNTGYFATFFEEIQLLGRGGAGSVHLVRHVLNGEQLGLYACKKVAVGDSYHSLLHILREVHLLEVVQHPNIVTYHHAWVENSSLSAFSPSVPTLHILMAYANGGSLDTFINQRRGGPAAAEHDEGSSARQRKENHRLRNLGAVHLLRLDEILQLFENIANGLAFLHARNILHLDMKAENVLLQWEENDLLPTAKLSDFGNATSDAWTRERTGGSGTLAYTAPESWEQDAKTGRLHIPDRATDQWALGLILHLLAFFTLPYRNEDDVSMLEPEIRVYPGFFPKDAEALDHGARHDVPMALLRLMARLVHRTPAQRPSCEKVLLAIQQLREDMASDPPTPETSALVRATSSSSRNPSPDITEIKRNPLLDPATEATITKIGGSPDAPVTVALPPGYPRRLSSLQQRQLLCATAALVKLAMIDWRCSYSRISRLSVYILLVSTVLDLVCAELSLSLVLGAGQLLWTWLGPRNHACA